jgi:Ser/Thr protein kinase RdoA (MazF antagonist)
MALRTELGESELHHIARIFGLEPLACHLIEGGWENTSYLITASEGEFVATVVERRSLPDAEARADLLCRLSLGDLPVPAPRRTRKGGWAVSHNGKPVVVCSFVDGICGRPLDADQLFELGSLLARIHGSGADCEMPPGVRLAEADLEWLASRGETDAFARWALARHEDLAAAVASDHPRVPTHGDPFGDNIVVTSGGGLVLIDWDDAALDLPEIDLGMAILAHCENNGLDLSRVETLLAGYRRTRFAGADLGRVLQVAAYAGLVVAYWRYRRQLSGQPAPGSPRSMWAMVDSLCEASGSTGEA